MSEANVDILRRGYELAASGDAEGQRRILAEDARWYSALGGLMGKTLYVGYDEISRLVLEEIPSVLEGFRPDLLEIRGLGGERLLAVVRWRATLRASGMELDQVFGQLCVIRDGRWQEMRSYESVEAAEAAGVALRFVDALNARDLDALVALCHPEVDGRCAGREGIRRWAAELIELAAGHAFEADEVRVDGDDVTVTGHRRGTPPADEAFAFRVRLADGAILRVRAEGLA